MQDENRDVALHEDDDGKWFAFSATNHSVEFSSEDAACEFQRNWRALHGLDPMTGNVL